MQPLTAPPTDFADGFNEARYEVVASYPTYRQAQQAIDQLAADGFPVQHTEISGVDLRMVEHVTGRMTSGRAAVAGAATGAWVGLLIGLLVGLFTFGPAWIGLILGGLVIGSVWGALFGVIAHQWGSGRHGYASIRSLAASRYELLVGVAYAERAEQLLSPLS